MIDDDVHSSQGTQADETLHGRLALATQATLVHERNLWLLLGVFWLANAGLFIALFSSGDFPFDLISYTVCAGGVLLGGVAWLVLSREADQAARCRDLLERLDRRLQQDPDLRLPAVGPDWRMRGLAPASAFVCAGLWLIALILFVIASQRGGFFS